MDKWTSVKNIGFIYNILYYSLIYFACLYFTTNGNLTIQQTISNCEEFFMTFILLIDIFWNSTVIKDFKQMVKASFFRLNNKIETGQSD